MLMVTTTMGMLNGVHSNTTNLGPGVTLDLVFVVGTSGLKHGLVDTASTGDHADHGAVSGRNNLKMNRLIVNTGLDKSSIDFALLIVNK